MTSAARAPVARLSSPGAIAATIPLLCGFDPQDSLVVLSLRGERRRLGLTARLDLPDRGSEPAAGAMLAGRVALDGARAAVVAVFSPQRRPTLVRTLSDELEQRGIEVMEALHVDRGLWWSYVCRRRCCPPEGTAVPEPPGLVQAQRALSGRAVLASREELVASLSPPAFLAAQQAAQALEAATVGWVRERAADPRAARDAAVRQAHRMLVSVRHGAPLDADDAARLAVVLHDVLVRDEVVTWALKSSDALLSLLEQAARQVVPPYDAPLCTVLAQVAFARGDGSRVNVALDRALATDPEYSLALLLRTALDGGLTPRDVRSLLRATRRALRELSSPG